MHFTYDHTINRKELMQGDVLERTPLINDLLKEVHPHFFENLKNRHFLVLTQSCDLVIRSEGGRCKPPYITIAPIRTLDLVVERFFSQFKPANISSDTPVVGEKAKTRAVDFLSRLFNNNEPGFFYLEGGESSFTQDSVAFLNLSIAIKSDLHFEKCLNAKILQLMPEFQAKLGWLVGQMYSRVGTQDWPAAAVKAKINSILQDVAIWIPDTAVKDLEKEFTKQKESDPDKKLSETEIHEAIKNIPTQKERVLDQVMSVLAKEMGQRSQSEIDKIRRRLEYDGGLTALLRK